MIRTMYSGVLTEVDMNRWLDQLYGATVVAAGVYPHPTGQVLTWAYAQVETP